MTYKNNDVIRVIVFNLIHNVLLMCQNVSNADRVKCCNYTTTSKTFDENVGVLICRNNWMSE